MDRYLCIHGHFYQPPRENPWLEAIELQDSAYPYHDWNERISAECYAPNAAARILDGEGWIVRIANNYSRISFNFGPTLLSWLEEKEPETYRAILAADRESQHRYSGHGSAVAQAYNHVIMPLANERDKRTQVFWGIRDFENRFGRRPEGMWLPETAADLETLDILAEQGIQFTVLSPYQAGQVRKVGDKQWLDVVGGKVDPTMPYWQHLPSGRKIALFFYDGPVSQAVAFEQLLTSGERFAHRLTDIFNGDPTRPQLAHIATDGETYGHHHHHGEMALAYALDYIETEKLATLTNYGEFLEMFPPTHEVQIIENTSWSCYHGIERWRSDCGCNSGGHSGWNQAWRTPLRDALDWLRDTLSPKFVQKGKKLFKDPWIARDDYITAILDRSPDNVNRFLDRHAIGYPDEEDRVTMLKLMELQRHAMLMYTSCGWFFDELSGIETVQVIHYAGRAIQLAEEALGESLEDPFLERLALAKSNIPAHGDGAKIYARFVKPVVLDLQKVGAHYALSSLFQPYAAHTRIYCYRVDSENGRLVESGRSKLVVGRARVTSEITQETKLLTFGVLHFGDHNITGGVREYQGEDSYRQLMGEATQAFEHADLPGVIRVLDKHFLELTYSLRSLFRDEQRNILHQILESSLNDVTTIYRQVYEQYAPLMRFLSDLNMPLPKVFYSTAEFVLNANLRAAFENDELDLGHAQFLLEEARREDISLDTIGLAYALQQTTERWAERFRQEHTAILPLERLEELVELANSLPFPVNLSQVQNIYYELMQTVYPDFQRKSERGDEAAKLWIGHFASLGAKLSVRVPD